MKRAKRVKVGVVKRSESDRSVMRVTSQVFKQLMFRNDAKVVSTRRTPDRMAAYAKSARARGLEIIIAGAGGAAHSSGRFPVATFSIGASLPRA